MTEDSKKVWKLMETEFGWSNQPEDFHLEYFEDIVKATKQALTIPVVMPSFLTHPYAQVVCTNKGELNYVLEWAKQNGKEVSEHQYKVEKFPYHLFLAGDIVGWTDSTNRIGDKFSFREFVDGVNWA